MRSVWKPWASTTLTGVWWETDEKRQMLARCASVVTGGPCPAWGMLPNATRVADQVFRRVELVVVHRSQPLDRS